MKKLLFVTILLSSIVGFKSDEKIKLPINSQTGKIEYASEIQYTGISKDKIYDKIIKWAYLNYSEKEIREKSQDNGIISLVGRTTYLYRGDEKQLGYKLVFLINDNHCKIVITNLNIKHKNLEILYDDYNNGGNGGAATRKLTKVFESINSSLTGLISKINKEFSGL